MFHVEQNAGRWKTWRPPPAAIDLGRPYVADISSVFVPRGTQREWRHVASIVMRCANRRSNQDSRSELHLAGWLSSYAKLFHGGQVWPRSYIGMGCRQGGETAAMWLPGWCLNARGSLGAVLGWTSPVAWASASDIERGSREPSDVLSAPGEVRSCSTWNIGIQRRQGGFVKVRPSSMAW